MTCYADPPPRPGSSMNPSSYLKTPITCMYVRRNHETCKYVRINKEVRQQYVCMLLHDLHDLTIPHTACDAAITDKTQWHLTTLIFLLLTVRLWLSQPHSLHSPFLQNCYHYIHPPPLQPSHHHHTPHHHCNNCATILINNIIGCPTHHSRSSRAKVSRPPDMSSSFRFLITVTSSPPLWLQLLYSGIYIITVTISRSNIHSHLHKVPLLLLQLLLPVHGENRQLIGGDINSAQTGGEANKLNIHPLTGQLFHVLIHEFTCLHVMWLVRIAARKKNKRCHISLPL